MADQRSEIQDSIRQILFRNWDPIGVNDNPNLADEYDSYIAGVYQILTASRSEEDLMEYLSKAEDTMGMQCQSPDQLRSVARALLALDLRFDPNAA
jgi:hypothetical protein